MTQKRTTGGDHSGPLPPLPCYHGGSPMSRSNMAEIRMVEPFPPAPRRAFGSGFARPSALALRCCGASPYGPLRRAFGQGCARPSAGLRSAVSPRPASGRAVSGGLRPPLAGPLASRSLSLGFGICGMRRGCGVAARPSRPALRVRFSPRASALASRGIGRAFASGRRPLAPLPFCEPGLRPCSRAARRPGEAAPPPV